MGRKQDDAAKAARERQIFEEFCSVSGVRIDAGSLSSDRPPNPDIRCSSHGKKLLCEMAEITDEGLASSVAESIATGGITGGAFSQDEPLRKVFAEKSLKQYGEKGAELHLLVYYDKQYPLDYDPTFIPDTIGAQATAMVGSGRWQKIWVYDT